MDERIDELRARLQRVNASMQDVNHAAAAARRRDRVVRDRHARFWVLGEKLLRTVLIIYVLAGYVHQPAMHFLKLSGRRRRWPEKRDGELQSIVDNCFAQASVEELADLTDVRRPLDEAAMRAAVKVLREWDVYSWGTELNIRGIAPATHMVIQHAHLRGVPIPAGSKFGRAREWARRMRKRWGVRMGKLRAREVIDTSDLRAKVRIIAKCTERPCATFFPFGHMLVCLPLLACMSARQRYACCSCVCSGCHVARRVG